MDSKLKKRVLWILFTLFSIGCISAIVYAIAHGNSESSPKKKKDEYTVMLEGAINAMSRDPTHIDRLVYVVNNTSTGPDSKTTEWDLGDVTVGTAIVAAAVSDNPKKSAYGGMVTPVNQVRDAIRLFKPKNVELWIRLRDDELLGKSTEEGVSEVKRDIAQVTASLKAANLQKIVKIGGIMVLTDKNMPDQTGKASNVARAMDKELAILGGPAVLAMKHSDFSVRCADVYEPDILNRKSLPSVCKFKEEMTDVETLSTVLAGFYRDKVKANTEVHKEGAAIALGGAGATCPLKPSLLGEVIAATSAKVPDSDRATLNGTWCIWG